LIDLQHYKRYDSLKVNKDVNMKKIGILALVVIFMACGKDEVCTASTFVGTYSADGTICSVAGGNKLVIAASGETISLAVSGTGGTLTLSNIQVTSCAFNANIDDTASNTKLALTGNLDGKNLNLTLVGTFSGKAINCTEKWKK
jgi:hypothetical protein